MGQRVEDGWIAQAEHDEVDRLMGLPNGVDEGEAQILLRLVGIEARGLTREGLVGRDRFIDDPNGDSAHSQNPKNREELPFFRHRRLGRRRELGRRLLSRKHRGFKHQAPV